ncbi:FAD-dependent oxidoreductase [Nonomuraea ferruginea]
MDEVDVVVIGAGQAGLSSAYFLRRFGHDPLVLDADDGPGGAWRHRSPTLTMDKVHGVFDLPGVRRDPARDGDDRPAASVVPAYYAAYERELGLDVRRPAKVTAVEPGPADRLLITARLGTATTSGIDAASSRTGEVVAGWAARAVVNATGTWTRPYWPYYPGAADFRGSAAALRLLSRARRVRRAAGGRGGRRPLGRARAGGAGGGSHGRRSG